jgi:hypothetical protein
MSRETERPATVLLCLAEENCVGCGVGLGTFKRCVRVEGVALPWRLQPGFLAWQLLPRLRPVRSFGLVLYPVVLLRGTYPFHFKIVVLDFFIYI